ncbi:hypothetical protein M2368_003436 [Arthrobacter sp. JUb119]|nr:hypothetical protein [Arthrobacter sp. JUb119]TDU22497.1 hypothetical protein EDF61_10927 [Arthrobacter sp. JUb115]
MFLIVFALLILSVLIFFTASTLREFGIRSFSGPSALIVTSLWSAMTFWMILNPHITT